MCYPSDETIIKQVKAAVKGKAINDVFIATDSRDLISKLKKAMPKVLVKNTVYESMKILLSTFNTKAHFYSNDICLNQFLPDCS